MRWQNGSGRALGGVQILICIRWESDSIVIGVDGDGSKKSRSGSDGKFSQSGTTLNHNENYFEKECLILRSGKPRPEYFLFLF